MNIDNVLRAFYETPLIIVRSVYNAALLLRRKLQQSPSENMADIGDNLAAHRSESWSQLFMLDDVASGVLQSLNKQRTQHIHVCDVKLRSVDDEVFPCHRAVLSSQCKWMRKLLRGDRPELGAEIRIPHRGEDIRELLEFIYTGAIDIRESNCWRLYSVTCFLQMVDDQLENEILRVVVRLLQDTDLEYFKSDDFYNIGMDDMDKVVEVLMKAARSLGNRYELRVMEAVGRWANIDFAKRGQTFLEIDNKYEVSLNLNSL